MRQISGTCFENGNLSPRHCSFFIESCIFLSGCVFGILETQSAFVTTKMSHSRKHLTQKIVNEYPIPKDQQKFVKVIELRGSNICEVQEPDGTKFLVSFPAKFRKLIWIKRGKLH